jgi:NAD(P)-dependent dehydrogenase (short-subunit alcohol dehydrogenase family)
MNTQVVLITGVLTGIGRATALAFAKEGAQVVVSGRHDEEGQKLVNEIRKAGAEAEFIRADGDVLPGLIGLRKPVMAKRA